MDAKVWVPAVVAVLAAVAAFISARQARQSADGIDRRRHLVEALDHEAETFQEAFAAFIRASVGIGGEDKPRDHIEHLGALVAASAILRNHPRSDQGMHTAVENVTVGLLAAFTTGDTSNLNITEDHLKAVEDAAREVVRVMGDERRALVTELRARHWWQRQG